MLHINWLVIALAALIPLLVGAIWYSKTLFADSWLRAARMRENELKNSNMLLIFGLTYILSFMLALALNSLVIHQFHLYSIVARNNSPEAKAWLADSFTRYGTAYRTFKHGASHGLTGTVFFVLPIVSILALFERRSINYIAIHVGYWLITLVLMGGVICQWT